MRRIPIILAQPGMRVAQNVVNNEKKVLLSAGAVLTQSLIQKLMDYGVLALTVETLPDSGPEEDSVGSTEDQALLSRPVPEQTSNETRAITEATVRGMMADVILGKRVQAERVKKSVQLVFSELMNRDFVIEKLSLIRALDDYSFTHSINVCIFAVSLGMILGYTRPMLLELAIGGILHDIGKILVPGRILKKPGMLTDKEFAEVKRHPLYGLDILKGEPGISSDAMAVISQHHERFNGQGYPLGLTGKSIHEFARITAVVDVFDALTSNRAYKSAMLPYEAVEVIMTSSNSGFDTQIVKAFLENINIYPRGSIVELNNGAVAVVTAVNRSLPTRPRVKILRDEVGLPVAQREEIDLVTLPSLFIREVLRIEQGGL